MVAWLHLLQAAPPTLLNINVKSVASIGTPSRVLLCPIFCCVVLRKFRRERWTWCWARRRGRWCRARRRRRTHANKVLRVFVTALAFVVNIASRGVGRRQSATIIVIISPPSDTRCAPPLTICVAGMYLRTAAAAAIYDDLNGATRCQIGAT